MDESGRVRELSELYRELQLLRLKYDQLVDICRKLSESWPNRGSDGRLLKASEASKPNLKREKCAQVAECSKPAAKGTEIAKTDAEVCHDSPELQLLDSILKKAQKIKLSDEEPKERTGKPTPNKFATESCKKAAKLYQAGARSSTRTSPRITDSKPKKKGSVSKSQSTASKATISSKTTQKSIASKTTHKSVSSTAPGVQSRSDTTLPAVKVVRHKNSGPVSNRAGSSASSSAHKRLEPVKVLSSSTTSLMKSSPSVSVEEEGEEKERQFQLSRDGSKLRMPSKYTTLRTTLLKFKDEVSSQTTDPSTAAMREHFVNRLLPQQFQGDRVSRRALELELARQEYQLLTEEAKSILGCEVAKDIVSAREKLESIVNRASAVEEKVAITEPSQKEAMTADGLQKINKEASSRIETCSRQKRSTRTRGCSGLGVSDNEPLVYSTLTELLQLVEAENRLRMARIETQLLKFCTEVVLPKYQLNQHHGDLSTASVQILSELAGRPKPIFICSDHDN